MTNRLRLRQLVDERGQSLVLALLVMTTLAIVLSTVIIFTSSNQRNANYQKSAQLATTLGAQIAGLGFVVELDFLKGRDKLKPYDVFSLLHYDK